MGTVRDDLLLKISQAHLNAQEKYGETSEYASFVKSILDTYIEQTSEIDRLDFHEATQIRLKDPKQNVVFLNSKRAEARQDIYSTPLAQEKKSAFNFPFIISALTTEDAFKMAINIHELSGRYAFLEITNLDTSTFKNKESYDSLGPLTIYISDIEKLSLELQQKINVCLSERNGDKLPQIILGTNKGLETLRSSNLVSREFLNKITVGYLHMDQPYSFYKNGDLIRFFAESLQARLTLDL